MVSRRRSVVLAVVLAGACAVWLRLAFLFLGEDTDRTAISFAAAQTEPLDALFPEVGTAEGGHFSWVSHNNRVMRSLLKCSDCKRGVVILAHADFLGAKLGLISGENVWANSVMEALDELGVRYLFADNIARAATQHALVPSLVRAVIGGNVAACAADNTCVKSAAHPLGIPAWKLWVFTFWPHIKAADELPLDERWVLAPEDWEAGRRSGHVYIGYSVERACAQRASFVPWAERAPVAWVLGKHKGYWQPPMYVWDGVDWTRPPNATATLPDGFMFVANANNFRTPDKELALPPGIENTCEDDWSQLAPEAFYARLASARLLVGVGGPLTSPTGYDALCLGVPFLNPVTKWDERDPEDRTKWVAQHDGLKYEDPPKVYNVLVSKDPRERWEQFWEAVLHAVNTPIDRYILERMTRAAVRQRVEAWLKHDWKADAEALMKE